MGVVAQIRPPSNLPRRLSSFVGRRREQEEVAELLGRTRLLTLTGAGGCGKTRLALQVATTRLDDYPGGVWWVELASVPDPALAGAALARALGIRPAAGQSELDAAVAFLARRRALVILDNCEHLLAPAAEIAEAVLRESQEADLLATSREPLRIAGETTWYVPSLSLPRGDRPEEGVLDSDAARLFVERAGEAQPAFTLGDHNADAVARICRELDGIPLAIELAAARVRVLAVEEIAAALGDRFRLLTGGARNSLVRQQTLRASVDWSHDLLDPAEAALLARLGVFRGSFTLDAAQRVCAGEQIAAADVLQLLASLVDKSLVEAQTCGASMRYRLLETVRIYALEQLAERGEVSRQRDRHLDAYLAYARGHQPGVMGWPAALAGLDLEEPNIAQAIDWALPSHPVEALELCAALSFWWHERGAFSAGEMACRRALEAKADTDHAKLTARVASGLAYLLLFAGKLRAARDFAAQAAAAAQLAGSRRLEARSLAVIGGVDVHWRPLAGREVLDRCCAIAREVRDHDMLLAAGQTVLSTYAWQADRRGAEALVDELRPVAQRNSEPGRLVHQGFLEGFHFYAEGEHEAARRHMQGPLQMDGGEVEPNCVALTRAWLCRMDVDAGAGDRALEELLCVRRRAIERGALMTLPWIECMVPYAQAATGRLDDALLEMDVLRERLRGRALHPLALVEADRAEVLRLVGDLDGAQRAANDALALATDLGNPWLEARARLTRGRVAAGRGEWGDAEHEHHAALATVVERRYALELPGAFDALAEMAAGLESWEQAARLLGAGRRAAGDMGLVAWAPRRAQTEQLSDQIRTALGDRAFEEALAEGAALSREQAIAWVRRARGARKRPSAGWESLTPTERAVAEHVACGLSNPEIAERMFVSRATVKTHLAHIYDKLRLTNRVQLARIADERLQRR